MSWHEDDYEDDSYYYEQEARLDAARAEELRLMAEAPVFDYLATYGDAIEERIKHCLTEAEALARDGYHDAALTRAASGMEVTIRFFLARPLVQGAFLSRDWANVLTKRLLSGRTAEDRELLPMILRNWEIDITQVPLADGSQAWEQIVRRVWPRRNDYVHKADEGSVQDAALAIKCLTTLLTQVVDPLATRLGFTREQTGAWSIVARENPRWHPPLTYDRYDPFIPSKPEPPEC